MRAWRAHEFGDPEGVLRLDEIDRPDPGPGELLIRTDAVTLNFNDLDGIHGRYKTVPVPVPYVPGMEVHGIVVEAGDGADDWVGRTVVAIPAGAFGGYAEYVIAPAAMAFAMPDDLPLPDAAAIFMPFHLAWLALYERARLELGETVLIHAGAGGAGSAAIQLAKLRGAHVVATASTETKRALCRDLGADVVLDYRTEDVPGRVSELTDGRGVDVAFDSIGGATTVETFRCMAFGGRHCLVGFASGIEAEDEGIVPRPVLFGNFSLLGVCHAYVEDPIAFRALTGFNFPAHADGVEVHDRIVAHVQAGDLRPVVGLELPFTELPRGLGAMERRETVGRVVVRVDA